MIKQILWAPIFGGIATAAIVVAMTSAPARAEATLPYCLSGGGGGYDNCNYASLAQCQISAANFGVCSPNPKFTASTPVPPAQRGRS